MFQARKELALLYLGIVSYVDPYKDDDYGNRRESTVFTTLIAQAQDAKSALARMRERLIHLRESDEKFYNVSDFYLEDFVEIEEIGNAAKDVSWISLIPFGDSFARLISYEEGNPSFRHYELRSNPGLLPNPGEPDLALNLQLIPVNEVDKQEEDTGDTVPLVSFDRDRRQIKPLYKELRKRKFKGMLPDFKELSDGDLYELYVVEGCLSTEIADLFEIKKSKVDYRRRKIGATLHEEATYDMLRGFGVIAPIPYKEQGDEA